MTTLMIPLGPIEFTPADVAMILTMLFLLAIVASFPASIPLSLYGARVARRTGRSTLLAGLLWGIVGTVLTLATLWVLDRLGADLPWALVPSWVPGIALAVALFRSERRHPAPHPGGPYPVYGPGTTTPGGPWR